MTNGQAAPARLSEYVDEEPMGVRDFEKHMFGHLSRSDRRKFWHALRAANLIVFQGADADKI